MDGHKFGHVLHTVHGTEKTDGVGRMKQAGLHIHISPTAAALFLGMLLTDRTQLCLAVLTAAFFHELGHLGAARLLRIPIRSIRLDLLGARMDAAGRMISYGEEWLLSAAGPLFSLVLAALSAVFWEVSLFACRLSCVSVLLGILNLLPVRSFDGGRMLSSFLSATVGERVSEHTLTVSSFLFLFLLWCFAVYCLLRVGDGLSLLCFTVSLFSRFFELSEG